MLSSFNDITLIIPTHERHEFLDRVLSWHAAYFKNIIILDSSAGAFLGVENYSQVEYFHLPEKKYLDKITWGVGLVKTKYTLFLADDDFLVVPNLEHAVSFLNENSDYVSYQGKHISFSELPMDKRIEFKEIHCFAQGVSHERDVLSERVVHFLASYMNNFYALQRTETWQSLSVLLEKSSNLNDQIPPPIFELTQSLNCIAQGKHKATCEPWAVREYIPESSGAEFDFDTFFSSDFYRDWVEMLSKFFTDLADEEKLCSSTDLFEGFERFIQLNQTIERKHVIFEKTIDYSELAQMFDDEIYLEGLVEHISQFQTSIVSKILRGLDIDCFGDYIYFRGWGKLVKNRLDRIIEELDLNTPLVIYGAGEHTTNLFSLYPEIKPKLIGITESQNVASPGNSKFGLNLVDIDNCIESNMQFLVSSLSSEPEITQNLIDNGVNPQKIYTLYKNIEF